MPKRGFWGDRNHYQAQVVRYVVSADEVYRLVVAPDGSVQGYGVLDRGRRGMVSAFEGGASTDTLARKFLTLLLFRSMSRRYRRAA